MAEHNKASESESKPPDQAAEANAPVADSKPTESRTAPAPPEGKHYFWGTGRRKKAVARIRIRPGTGKILINKRPLEEYFPREVDRRSVQAPFQALRMLSSWDTWANVNGGGFTGQAGAVALGLARALVRAIPDQDSILRDHGLLTRDARMKERKKYGQKGARKRFQFSKR